MPAADWNDAGITVFVSQSLLSQPLLLRILNLLGEARRYRKEILRRLKFVEGL